MIRYQLICDQSHEFESWFRSSDDFDRQSASDLLECPLCGSTHVKKALMAPSVKTARQQSKRAGSSELHASPSTQEIQSKMREMREHVTKNSEYVGPRFASVARDMHTGDEPERGIYGEAKGEEVKKLIEDGIHVLPLPVLPEEKN